MRKTFTTRSAKATEKMAAKFAGKLKRGRVIALNGPMGAGKTVFVKGLAKGLDFKEVIQSPTYVMMNVYPLDHKKLKTLVHVDCYRLNEAEEIKHVGLEDYWNDKEALVVIEWADKIKDLLPKKITRIDFKILDEYKRKISIRRRALL